MESAQAKIQSQNGFLDSDDDEEDGMFDFQSEHDKKIGAQILMLLTWMSLGLIYALPGPNLLAIACKVNSTLEHIGLLFISRGVGTLCGKLVSGFMIHHNKGYGIISIALVILPVMTAVFPLIKSLGGAACVMIVIGVAYGLAAEGYNIMDYSNGLKKPGGFNKATFALSLGAAVAPLISSPFLGELKNINSLNKTRSLAISNDKEGLIVFPGFVCLEKSDFGKSFWISTIPCCLLIFQICYVICSSSNREIGSLSENSRGSGTISWKVYGLRFILFLVLLLYGGIYRIAELVVFSYITLGPFDINTTKACLLVMMLWVAFAFGHILQHIVLIKIERVERRLGIAFLKSCVCLIMSILLMKIDNTNGLTLSLFVYMFFASELSPLVHDAVSSYAMTSEAMVKKLNLLADAFAEMLFPIASLALMYHKGWHALSFTIMVISVLQFLLCSFLALYPFSENREISSLQYENLAGSIEDGNGKKIRKEIRKLLGGYTDQEVSYVTSDEEVVFDLRGRSKVK